MRRPRPRGAHPVPPEVPGHRHSEAVQRHLALPDAADSGCGRRRARPRRECIPKLEASEAAPRGGRDGEVVAGEQDVVGEVLQSCGIS